MTIEEKRRELFEASMAKELIAEGYQPASVPSVLARGSDGEYQTIRMAGAWLGFNAALDAVVIELPRAFNMEPGDGPGVYPMEDPDGDWINVNEARAVLEAAGLKVLP